MTYVAPHMLSTVVSKRYIYDNPAMVKSLAEINMNRAQGSSSIARAISDLAEAITPSADSASNDSSNVDDNNGDDITGESNPTFFACGVTRQRKGVPSVQDILERRAKGVLDDPLSSTSAYASDNKDRDSSSRRYHYNPSNGDNIDLSRLDDGCGDDENARTHAREAYYVDLVPNKEKEYVVYDSMHNVYGFIESEGCFRKDNPIKWFASYGR